MEQGDPKNLVQAESSPKTKEKKKSLCRMLMNKKTRVGCLEVPYREGQTGEKDSKVDHSIHASNTSTKLSLCCAMTERSATPPRSLTAERLSPTELGSPGSTTKPSIDSSNGNCRHELAVHAEQGGMSPLLRRQFCPDCCNKRNGRNGQQSRNSACNEGNAT